MSIFRFSGAPAVRHHVHVHADGVQVDDARLAVRSLGEGSFITTINGRSEKGLAVAHGDAVYVQLRGRAWRIEKIDPTRSSTGSAAGAAGLSVAPMPGVVVSLHAQVGQRVAQGETLLVIESMKLQMTIAAAADCTVVELPVSVGQSFQRGAVLARTEVEQGAA
jgi:biotin carboxyl carrier protein